MEPENVTPGNKTPKSPWGRYVYIIKRMKIIYVKYVLNCFQNSEHLIGTYQCGSWDMDWGSQFRSKFPLCLPNNSRAEIFSNWMAELNNLNLHPHYFTKLESYEDSTIPGWCLHEQLRSWSRVDRRNRLVSKSFAQVRLNYTEEIFHSLYVQLTCKLLFLIYNIYNEMITMTTLLFSLEIKTLFFL
jgi:hypothetical protein